MKRTLIFTWMLMLSACSTPKPPLSGQGNKAYRIVKKTDMFYDSAVGYGGDTPEVVHAFQELLNEKRADAAFKALLEKATLPGQLYALCGLWFTDPEEFKRQVPHYSSLKSKVPVMMGCVVAEDSVSELVKCNRPETVRLRGPHDSLKGWWKRNGNDKSARYDIAGGAWPSNFKEAR
jgi:hypothetical protein